MRLHRLELSAFGPFAGPQVIDFDVLSASGLFLLDGPTGAGKTTILDAITFALYGPGDRNGDGRLRSDFASRDVAPTVVLDFSVRGIRHRVTRSPEFERPKRRGEGTTRQTAQAHLERCDDGRWVSRSSNKAEIADMLADELGLTRDQFSQVVVLPQGEFARFLRASDDDRRALLTRLFGTQLYDRITEELERQGHAATRDLDAGLRRLRSCVSAAGEAAGMSGADREQLCELDEPHRALRLEQLKHDLAAAHALAQRAASAAATNTGAAHARSVDAAAAVELMRRYSDAMQRFSEHERQRGAHEQAQLRLEAARRAAAVRGLLGAVDDAAGALAEADAALRRLDPHLAPQELSDSAAAALDAEAAALLRDAAELQHLADQERDLAVLHEQVDTAAHAARQAAEQVGRFRARLAAIPDERSRVKDDLTAAREARALGVRAAASLPGLRAALQAERRLRGLSAARAAAVHRREQAVAAQQYAVDMHQSAVEARLRGMAAELARQLGADLPCPVCGATEHPHPAQPGLDAVRASDVQLLAERRADAEAARAAAEAALAAVDAEVAAAQVPRGQLSIAELERALAEHIDRVEAAEQATAVESALCDRDEDLATEQRQVADAVASAVAELATATAHQHALQQRCANLDAALAAARGDHDSVGARQAALRSAAQRAATLATAGRLRCAAAQQYAQSVARAEREAASAGFGDVEQARMALLTSAQLTELQAEVLGWEQTHHQLAAALGSEEFVCLDAEGLVAELPLARAAADHAAAELANAIDAEEHVAASVATTGHACQRFAQACADLQVAQADYERDAAESEAVRYLSKLTRGMAGQRRVALTTFVLRRWFEHVVHAANVRLLVISSGRYELVRVDETGGRNERAGLTLQVIDRHTGEARPARSLSGGETFYTSLALALGLADVVRAEAGGVDLDTLFIDEGFGSLDAQVLDEVMSVIEDLRDRGRVIGIVSHLADLKELIHERVEVRRLDDGSSTLRVVA